MKNMIYIILIVLALVPILAFADLQPGVEDQQVFVDKLKEQREKLRQERQEEKLLEQVKEGAQVSTPTPDFDVAYEAGKSDNGAVAGSVSFPFTLSACYPYGYYSVQLGS